MTSIFHCAKEGQKLDFIKANPCVCGAVIEDNCYKKACGQTFRSVVLRGKIVIIDDLKKQYEFEILMNQSEQDPFIIKNKYLKKDKTYENSGILMLDITGIIGKEQKVDS